MNMKWQLALYDDGTYSWVIESPIGPIYVDYSEEKRGWQAAWFKFDGDDMHEFGSYKTANKARVAAMRFLKRKAQKIAKAFA